MIDKIVDYQIKEKYIQEKEKNIYRYAYTVFIEECINIIISFFIGIFFRKLLFTICYLFSYISLRKFAGGYHSKSKWNCRVISLFLIVFSCVFDELFFETIKRENLYLFDIIAQIIILILNIYLMLTSMLLIPSPK